MSYVLNRPIEYNIGQYTPGLTESCVNIFHQEVTPTDFSKDRCSFQFKSPGLNTLLSSAVYLEFDLQITTNPKQIVGVAPEIAVELLATI